MNAQEIPRLAVAVNRWLSYQVLCGREALVSEAYLGHPLAEFLIHHHGGEFETEVDHPVLNAPGPGRPRQIDYVLRTPHSKHIEVAIECKWVTERPYDKQRILNDILRLECVREPGRYVKRYFLVAGLRDHFDLHFKSLALAGNLTFTKALLSFSKKTPDVKVSPRTATRRFQTLYKRFAEAFNASAPNSFRTKLLDYRTADSISVAIWQVSSTKHRTCFEPSERWPDA